MKQREQLLESKGAVSSVVRQSLIFLIWIKGTAAAYGDNTFFAM